MFLQLRFLTHLPSFLELVVDLSKICANEKRGRWWPRSSWNLFHFHMLLRERKVYESSIYFSRHTGEDSDWSGKSPRRRELIER
jgi:hypothetical protein